MPRFTIDVGGELDEQLSSLAETQEVTKAEIIRRAIAAYTVIKRETRKRQQADVAVVDESNNIVLKIAIP